MVWKTLTNPSAGDAFLVGGADFNKISNLFSGVADVDTVDMNSEFDFRNLKLRISDPTNAFQYILNSAAITANRNISLPLLTSDDTFLFANFAQTITNKTISGTSNTINAADAKNVIADYYMFIDAADGNKIKAKNNKTGLIEFTDIANPGHADIVLQACCNALTTGGMIFISKGTYNLYLRINTANSVDIIGDGRGKTILKRQLSTNVHTILLDGNNITFAHCTVDGNYPTNTSNGGFGELWFTGNNFLCYDVEFKPNGGPGPAAGSGGSGVFENCVFTGAGVTGHSYYGLLIYPPATVNTVKNCSFQYYSLNAIFTSGNTIIDGCYMANNAIAAGGNIANVGGTYTEVTNCVIKHGLGGDSGIEIGNARYVVTNNLVDGCTSWGIIIEGLAADNPGPTIVSNNIVKNTQYVGIAAHPTPTAPSNFIITNNLVYDDQVTHTQLWGITVDPGASDNYVIKNNICYGNVTGQISDSGTGSNKIVSDNIGATLTTLYTDKTQTNTAAKTFLDQMLLLRNPANTFSSKLVTGAMTADTTITIPAPNSGTVVNVLVSEATQAISTGKQFLDNMLRVYNPATTFLYNFRGSAITANRDITLPLLTANDTFSVLGVAQTNTAAKTFNDGMFLLRNPADTFSATIKAGAQTAARTFTFPVDPFDDEIIVKSATQVIDGIKQFVDNGPRFLNPGGNFTYNIRTSALTASRDITLPLLTAADTFVFSSFAQPLTNKTIDDSLNTIVPYNSVVSPLSKRTGFVVPSGGGNALTTVADIRGIFSQHTLSGAGTPQAIMDATEGGLITLPTTATGGLNSGIVSAAASQGVGRRAFSMRVVTRARADDTAATNLRYYFGFVGVNTLPISDVPIASGIAGVIVGFISTATNFEIYNNDETGAMVTTALTNTVAKNTSFHDIEINWTAGGNVNVIFDGVTTTLTTQIPATTTNLWFNQVSQTTTTTVKTQQIHGTWIEAGK